ncbi:hypothetical protein, partial [Streptomyces apricus]|uniref:hypothetical protein n=1 Tax=Streptomyces apricus TaxID=1828112 RepID=UPI001CAA850E
ARHREPPQQRLGDVDLLVVAGAGAWGGAQFRNRSRSWAGWGPADRSASSSQARRSSNWALRPSSCHNSRSRIRNSSAGGGMFVMPGVWPGSRRRT